MLTEKVVRNLQRVGLKSDGRDDGTLSHPRICKPLYGPS